MVRELPLGVSSPIFLCPIAQRSEALAVLYRRIPGDFRAEMVTEALAEERAGRLNLSGLWVARRWGRLVGALLSHELAGRAAAVWSPEVEMIWGRAAVAAGLLHAALGDLRARGFRVAQALVDPSGSATASADLVRGGLPEVTTLTFLERHTHPLDLGDCPAVERVFDWSPLGPDTVDDFRAVLNDTYLKSLDMPELEGVRSLDDVLASHRAAGRDDPTHWSVGHLPDQSEAAAVLLLSEVVDRPVWEVTYLGLTPAARGRGLGRVALEYAIDQARAAGIDRIELAVDARNTPARRLYEGAGFVAFDRRIVHLAILNPLPG